MPDTIHQFDYAPDAASSLMLANMAGELDCHIKQIETRLGVVIHLRGSHFHLSGPETAVGEARSVLEALYEDARRNKTITPRLVHDAIQDVRVEASLEEAGDSRLRVQTRKGAIHGRGPRQRRYLESIFTNDLTFGIGPAGTGKTYLAVAAAVDYLNREAVRRIVLVRPAVEAGERLGFLPGGLVEKVDPYLRPLYDALYEMLGFEKVSKLMDRQVIEVAPLAFMRGRTLNDSFIILDEAQNTTPEQMRMLLTRIGFGSKAVVTGDVTQVDLPRGQISGLTQAMDVLRDIENADFIFFKTADVVRHPLVARIVQAYQDFDERLGR